MQEPQPISIRAEKRPNVASMPTKGRPTSYSRELADVICEKLSEGTPLARICDDEAMPAYSTVRRWEDENEEFSALSARAKRDGTHFMADDCITISDDPLPAEPDEARVEIASRKLRIDTRLRLIGKWNAKEFGDKLDLTSGGEKLGLSAEIEASRRRTAKEGK